MKVHEYSYYCSRRINLPLLKRSLSGRKQCLFEKRTRFHRIWFDTFDWRLYNAGFVLRHDLNKSGSVLRLISLHDEDETMALNTETVPRQFEIFPQEWQQLEPLKAIGIRILMPLTEIKGYQSVYSILNEDGLAILRLQLWHGLTSSSVEDTTVEPLPERLTCMSIAESDSVLDELLQALQKVCELKEVDERVFFHDLLRPSGHIPGDYSSKIDLTLQASMTAFEAMISIFNSLLQKMEQNEQGTRQFLDTEFLHDFRVAIRRTRTGLALIKAMIPEKLWLHFREEFSWLGSVTGPLRDADVFSLTLNDYERNIHNADIQNMLKPFHGLLTRRKAGFQKQLIQDLASERYSRLKSEWKHFLTVDHLNLVLSPTAILSAPVVTSAWIFKAWRRVIKSGSTISPESSPDCYHRLRIYCKKLRYLLEFFRSLYPDEVVNPLIKDLKTLQDTLGDYHDCAVQQQKIQTYAEEIAKTRQRQTGVFLAMGFLQGLISEKQSKMRQLFDTNWRNFARKANRTAFTSLFKPSSS